MSLWHQVQLPSLQTRFVHTFLSQWKLILPVSLLWLGFPIPSGQLYELTGLEEGFLRLSLNSVSLLI